MIDTVALKPKIKIVQKRNTIRTDAITVLNVKEVFCATSALIICLTKGSKIFKLALESCF